MNAELVQRLVEGIKLFMARLVKSPPSPSPSEGEKQSEYVLSYGLAAQTTNKAHSCLLISHQSRRNSHSRNNFYPGRPVPWAAFRNVSIFNFSQESFSSNFIFASLLPVLLSFLQSSGTNPSPFELHPTAFTVSMGCSASYYLTIVAKFMFLGFASQFGALMSVFGSLSAATLISLTLHLPWSSIFFILLFMGGFFMLLNKLHAAYGTIHCPPPRMMQPLLPLYNVRFNN